jgi:hypothetical protein
MGPDPTDVIEMVSVDEQCPYQTVCSSGTVAGQPGEFVTREGVPACMTLPGLAVLTDNTSFVLQVASASALTGDCNAGNRRNGNLALSAALAPWPPVAAFLPASTFELPTGTVVFLYAGRVVRYRIAPNPDPADPEPALWRSETGRYRRDGTITPTDEPGAAGFTGTGGGSPWEMVARGIEDLQVEYFAGAGPWADRATARDQRRLGLARAESEDHALGAVVGPEPDRAVDVGGRRPRRRARAADDDRDAAPGLQRAADVPERHDPLSCGEPRPMRLNAMEDRVRAGSGFRPDPRHPRPHAADVLGSRSPRPRPRAQIATNYRWSQQALTTPRRA